MSYKIQRMEIYPNGVKVIFEINATGEMRFELPAAFDANRVKPVVTPGLELLYFQVKSIHKPHFVPKALEESAAKIRELDEEINLLNSKKELLDGHNSLYSVMPEQIGADAGAYVRDVQKLRLENLDESARITSELYKRRKERDIIANDYNEKLPPNPDYAIEVKTGVKAGKLIIEAFSPYGGWNPSYRLNLNSETGEIEAVFLAGIHQRTGVSFAGEVRLFTQAPSIAVKLPKLNTWPVDFYEEPARPAPTKMTLERKMEHISFNMEEGEISDAAVIPAQAAVMAESPVNISINTVAKIDGNGAPVSVNLKKFTLHSKHKVRLASDYGNAGWLVCEIDDMPEPLLPGAIDLYVDGQPSGSITTGYVGRGVKAELPFGQMPLIKLKKTGITAKSGTGRFLSSSGSIEDGYTLEITNGSGMKIDIELFDRVPYPINDKINLVFTAMPEPDGNRENVLKWDFTMEPGDKRAIEVRYKIKYPAQASLDLHRGI